MRFYKAPLLLVVFCMPCVVRAEDVTKEKTQPSRMIQDLKDASQPEDRSLAITGAEATDTQEESKEMAIKVETEEPLIDYVLVKTAPVQKEVEEPLIEKVLVKSAPLKKEDEGPLLEKVLEKTAPVKKEKSVVHSD